MQDDELVRDAAFRAYDRAMKLKFGAAAAVLVAVLAGCGSTAGSSAPSSTVPASAEAVPVGDWKQWGAFMQGQLAQCESTEWDCLYGKAYESQKAVADWPNDPDHTGFANAGRLYIRAYQDYERSGCAAGGGDLVCASKRITLDNDRKEMIRAADRAAEGKTVSTPE